MPSLDHHWRKSSHSGNNGACVEVRRADDGIEVRDTKDRAGAVLSFAPENWRTFVSAVHNGEFDRH